MRSIVLGGVLFVAALGHCQNSSVWVCSDDVSKEDGDNHRIRTSTGVSEAFVDKRVLPDTTDLKGTKTNSIVIIKALVDKSGVVRCAEPVQGDTNLLQRSVDAAKQWRFKPYLLNGQPIIVETPIEFVFKKSKVTAR